MLQVEDLLNPIEPDAPVGQNLRYHPVFDQIAEARSEEDATLPVGSWSRQTKKADYPLVSTLAREALAKQSKDLWLAAWLGEAQIKLEGLSALPTALNLLLGLQERFWNSLYPEIDEGDLGMRVAPLQWAMERYSSLVYELPAVADAISYLDYKAVRRPGLAGTNPQAATEALDAALEKTGKAFYISAEGRLAATRDSLEKLYLFCDEKYRDDGPSFAKLRTAVDEVHNIVVSQLRAKREQEPDPVAPDRVEASVLELVPSTPEEVLSAQPEFAAQGNMTVLVPEEGKRSKASSTVHGERVWQQETDSMPGAGTKAMEPQSWEAAAEQIRQCAAYLYRASPASPVPYLLLVAMQHEGMKADEIGLSKQPPSSELRMALRRISREGGAQSLLDESLRALALPCGRNWLDLHRYIWWASRERGYQAIAESVLDVVRTMLRQDDSLAESIFEDDTPTASEETRQWIEAEGLLPARGAPALEEAPIPEAPQTSPAAVSRVEQAPPQKEADVSAEAEELATGGNLAASIQLLMRDAAASPARRSGFQRRLQASRLCLGHGQKTVARRVLEQLLADADEYRLELWEGSHVVAEVIAMLLESLDENEESERRALWARLCRIDPARALTLAVQV